MADVHVAIFEDDEDLAYHFQELLEMLGYTVSIHYSWDSIQNHGWENIGIILADYRNNFVKFKDVLNESKSRDIPMIAISGGDMDYKPCLQKPFTIEEIQAAIEKVLAKKKSGGGLFSMFKKSAS